MSGKFGQTVDYITRDLNRDQAVLISRAPGAGAWWATIVESQRTVKVAERTKRSGRAWYEVE